MTSLNQQMTILDQKETISNDTKHSCQFTSHLMSNVKLGHETHLSTTEIQHDDL